MDIDLKKIKTILQEEFNVSIILVSEQNGEYNFRKLNISKEVANEFSDTISEKAIAIINDVAGGQKTLIEYNPGYKKDAHQIECMDISGTSINNFIESIPVTTGIEVFNSKQEDEDFINSLRFYMLLFETQNEVG